MRAHSSSADRARLDRTTLVTTMYCIKCCQPAPLEQGHGLEISRPEFARRPDRVRHEPRRLNPRHRASEHTGRQQRRPQCRVKNTCTGVAPVARTVSTGCMSSASIASSSAYPACRQECAATARDAGGGAQSHDADEQQAEHERGGPNKPRQAWPWPSTTAAAARCRLRAASSPSGNGRAALPGRAER